MSMRSAASRRSLGLGSAVSVAHSDASGASASAAFVSYLGSGASDKINGLAVSNGRIFVAGDPGIPLPDEPAVIAAMRDALVRD